MTNEEKAKEIAVENKQNYFEGDAGWGAKTSNSEDECYESAMQMAEWKEQQMIDKAVEWLKSSCTYNDNGVEKCIVNLGFFIDAMKVE